MSTAPREMADRALAKLALVWAGVAIGIAFVATPAKFLAPSLSLPVALEVGQRTFHVYNAVEVGLAVLGLGLSACSSSPRRRLAFLAAPALVVAAQAAWLLPALDIRVATVQAGAVPGPSHLHVAYIVLEAAKILALLFIGLARTGSSTRRRSARLHPLLERN